MKIYFVMINGLEHVMQLSAEDAKRYDAVEVPTVDAEPAETETEAEEKAAPAPANKARRPAANK